MRRNEGFTLLELMVVVLILGALTATAFPTYHSFRSRAVGAEARSMMKQIIDGEIAYYLEHDGFFPSQDKDVTIWADGKEDPSGAIPSTNKALKISIQPGRELDYTIRNLSDSCLIMIDSSRFRPLFKGGETYLYAMLDKEGRVTYLTYEGLTAALGG